MIKNLNTTLTLISFMILLIITFKVGFGSIFSSHHKSTLKDNWFYLKDYTNNIEE